MNTATEKPLLPIGMHVRQEGISYIARAHKTRFGKVIKASAERFTVQWYSGPARDYDATYLTEGAAHPILPDERGRGRGPR